MITAHTCLTTPNVLTLYGQSAGDIQNRKLKEFESWRISPLKWRISPPKKWLPLSIRTQQRAEEMITSWTDTSCTHKQSKKACTTKATPRHTPLTPASRHSDQIEISGKIASTTSAILPDAREAVQAHCLVAQHVNKKNTGQAQTWPLGIADATESPFSFSSVPKSELHGILVFTTHREVQFKLPTATR